MQPKRTVNWWLKAINYFGYTMVLFYFALGLSIIFTNAFQEIVGKGALRISFGVVLILYSFFRAFRVYKKIKEDEKM